MEVISSNYLVAAEITIRPREGSRGVRQSPRARDQSAWLAMVPDYPRISTATAVAVAAAQLSPRYKISCLAGLGRHAQVLPISPCLCRWWESTGTAYALSSPKGSATPETWTEGIALLIAIVGLMFTSPIVFTGLLCRRAFSSLSPPLTHCSPGLSGGVLCILWLKE